MNLLSLFIDGSFDMKKAHSEYRGVTRHTPSGRWIAESRDPDGKLHQRYYGTEREAAAGYDKLAQEIRGNDAQKNFPEFDQEM